MATSENTTLIFARIHNMEMTEYKATRLTLKCNYPFMTKYYRFNVFNKRMLQKENGTPFVIDDYVEAEICFSKPYHKLIQLCDTFFDMCSVCHRFLPAIDAQRMECECCSMILERNPKQYFDKQLKLISLTHKQYKYGPGVVLRFVDTLNDTFYAGVVFKNNPLYDEINKLEPGQTYSVNGWVETNDTFIDIVQCTM